MENFSGIKPGDIFTTEDGVFTFAVLDSLVINDRTDDGFIVPVAGYRIKHTQVFEPYLVTEVNLTSLIEEQKLVLLEQQTTLVENKAREIIVNDGVKIGHTYNLNSGIKYTITEKISVLSFDFAVRKDGFMVLIDDGKTQKLTACEAEKLTVDLLMNCSKFAESEVI